MTIKKIKPKRSSFKYNPMSEELCLTINIQFYFNLNSQKLELTQYPYGAKPVNNVMLSNDLSELQFDAVYRGKTTHFVISSRHECDKVIYDFFSKVADNGFSVGENGLFGICREMPQYIVVKPTIILRASKCKFNSSNC